MPARWNQEVLTVRLKAPDHIACGWRERVTDINTSFWRSLANS
ncbi:hypothetical protein [Scytonema sp. NUACC21]